MLNQAKCTLSYGLGSIVDKDEIAVIDVQTHQVVNHWPVAPAKKPSGLALDQVHHRLFTGGDNKLMTILDSATGKVVASVPIGDDPDAVAFDPGTQLAFSSNGEGTVTIVHEDSPDKLTVVQTLKTQSGAKTIAIDPKTHRIFLPVGTGENFKILVYGM